MLPQPVVDLRAERTGDMVILRWTMPVRTTDRVVLSGGQRGAVCRAVEGGPCVPAGSVLFAPGALAKYSDALPPELRAGSLRSLHYQVRLQNRRGSDAGPSNAALSAAGAAPPAIGNAEAEATPTGIVVRWQAAGAGRISETPAGAGLLVRLQRERILRAGENRPSTADERQGSVPQPALQLLEAPEHFAAGAWTPNHTTDAEAALNRSYRYQVALVERVRLGGQIVQVSGMGAQTPVLAADDRFPPAVPTGLAVVANPEGKAIDLSWNPDSEPDLRGYFIYRREVGSPAGGERVSGAKPVEASSWSDTTARSGVRYAYSLSAVDADGNESGRSPESVETLP